MYHGDGALTVGHNNLHTANNADIGASTDDRTVRVVVHLREPVPHGHVDLLHATSLAGTWSIVDSSLQVSNLQNNVTPDAIVGVSFTGAINRYIGVRFTSSASTNSFFQPAELASGTVGALHSADGTIPAGGRFGTPFPGLGVYATASQVTAIIDESHGLVTPTNNPNQIILRYRQHSTSGGSFTSLTLPFDSNAGGFDRFAATVTSGIFTAGVSYDVRFRRAGAGSDHELNDGSGMLDATILATVE